MFVQSFVNFYPYKNFSNGVTEKVISGSISLFDKKIEHNARFLKILKDAFNALSSYNEDSIMVELTIDKNFK